MRRVAEPHPPTAFLFQTEAPVTTAVTYAMTTSGTNSLTLPLRRWGCLVRVEIIPFRQNARSRSRFATRKTKTVLSAGAITDTASCRDREWDRGYRVRAWSDAVGDAADEDVRGRLLNDTREARGDRFDPTQVKTHRYLSSRSPIDAHFGPTWPFPIPGWSDRRLTAPRRNYTSKLGGSHLVLE
ncbi:hypothetical protein EVAR_98381_1 [Eumeta japonica]|uniref:Uncharacterized protein n=1 Tax=Eumeta variegata TaxID=151549 RepID=A0A4C1XQ95_EUMVA|nr:hypothetical protein EVAR_98381_1 [Eumeta japonica]